MLIGLTSLVQRAKFLVNDNSTTILTAVAVAGTVSTAVLTGRATFKAARLIDAEKRIEREALSSENSTAGNLDLTLFSKIKLVWRHYIPPFVSGITTITCIVVANKIASKKIAALAVASGISERALQEYKNKVVEKMGERSERNMRDEIAQDRVNKNPPNSREVILAGTGRVLCYDMATGRYFQSTIEEIKRAENKINHTLNNQMYASASEFYDEIGLPPTTYSDSVGWDANNQVEVVFSTTMSSNEQPCIAIDFVNPPITDYARKLYD